MNHNIDESMDIEKRLEQLKEYASEGVTWLTKKLHEHSDIIKVPYIYPILDGHGQLQWDGNIQLEWDINQNDISLEVDLQTHIGELHCVNLQTEDVDTLTLNLDKPESWAALHNFLLMKEEK